MRVAHSLDHGTPETPGTRYTRALVKLTRAVWHPECSLRTALGLICETAAQALGVARVNVWRFDADVPQLVCIHHYSLATGTHAPAESLETLPLDGDYAEYLQYVRAIDAQDVETDPSTATSHGALRDYLRRHRICSLLDAPVRVEGELVGVICHEQVGSPCTWTPEEVAFAGSMGDFVAMAVEIDRRCQLQQQLEHLRLHDAGTDLPNRDYLVERVRMRLGRPHAACEPAAVVHVQVNLPYGAAMPAHAPTVEEVMAEIALRLRPWLGTQDALARVRADAFAVLPHQRASERDVVAIAERCVDAVRGMSGWRGLVEASAAVGVAFARDLPEGDPRVLLRNAELASDRAREQGRHRYEVFDIDHHRTLVERLRLEQAIREALEHDGFVVHYQPEYDLGAGRWAAAEALVRWRQDDSLLTPEAFIGVAESSGLIVPLGRAVLARACRDARDWPAQEPPLSVRVNVSAMQFDAADLVDDVASALAESGLEPRRLCLELTETTLMRDAEQAVRTMQRLKALGVHLAIDDFGTGYSSLAYLNRFPIDVVKIDRSFIAGLPHARFDTAIVTAIRELARVLDIQVVAEGVETAAQREALRTLGVLRMQGWLYARAQDQASLLRTFAAPPG